MSFQLLPEAEKSFIGWFCRYRNFGFFSMECDFEIQTAYGCGKRSEQTILYKLFGIRDEWYWEKV